MTGVDPADREQVVAALVHELRTRWPGVDVRRQPLPVAAATSTWVWFVDLTGPELPAEATGPLVLRIFDRGQEVQADRESRLCDRLAASGFPAPATAWRGTLGDHPAQLQRRLPGVPAMEAIAGLRIRSVVRSLGALQAELHTLPADRFDVPTLTAIGYLDADLGRRRASVSAIDPSGTWDWLRRTAPIIDADRCDAVLCHGDFHPLNAVVATDRSIGIVDWTDACRADRHLDVGRTVTLFQLAFVLAQRRSERWALRALRGHLVAWHLAGYQHASGVVLDHRVLAWWQVVHSYRGWLQLAELDEATVTDRQSTTIEAFPSDLPARLLARCVALRRAVAM